GNKGHAAKSDHGAPFRRWFTWVRRVSDWARLVSRAAAVRRPLNFCAPLAYDAGAAIIALRPRRRQRVAASIGPSGFRVARGRMSGIIVVDQPADWPVEIPGITVVSAW